MPVQRWSERIWVMQLAHDPAFTDEIDTLTTQAGAESPMPHIVLDMSSVEHVNSANLSQLLQLRKVMIDGDARLRLTAPNNQVWAMFLATGLDKVFDFKSDTSTALADLQIQK